MLTRRHIVVRRGTVSTLLQLLVPFQHTLIHLTYKSFVSGRSTYILSYFLTSSERLLYMSFQHQHVAAGMFLIHDFKHIVPVQTICFKWYSTRLDTSINNILESLEQNHHLVNLPTMLRVVHPGLKIMTFDYEICTNTVTAD